MKLDLGRLKGGESLTSRLSFRAKLLLVLFVPFLALVVVAAAGLSDRFEALHAQQQYGDLSGPLHSLDVASRALQNESVVSSWYVGSNGAPAAELQKARDRTNVAVADFRANEQAFADAGLSTTALTALDTTNQGFDAIKGQRAKVDAHTSSAAETRGFFLGVDEHLLDFGERVTRDLASSDVAGAMTRVYALERAQHELAREASIQIAVIATGAPQGFSEWVGAQVAQSQQLAGFANTATVDELAAYTAAMGQPKPAAELPTAFPAAGQTPGEYYVDYQGRSATLDKAIVAVDAVVNQAANAAAGAALREVRIYGGAAVFAMLLTLLLIWFVSRAVVGPIRRLTAAAREMSQRQLPALVESMRTGGDVSEIRPVHIDVQSEDEIGELAQAFNDVEAVTFEVAQEQSRLLRKGMGDLFVNLARRNQSLVQRQLELLDDLERNEHDPGALDALFKLDHMATRMRRNAESLLVLSGAEQPRQWQQPIPLIDVVRAAAAEIADFPRVELVGIDDQLAVSGRAVSDVAHLLAELLENATAFSPPESAVIVSGAIAATGFVLAVSDQGIGMPPERIAEANRLLAKPPAVGLALSRALGLHVVGSLASRHGISVELRPGAPSGLVALIALPTAVLEPRARVAPQAPARPLPPTPAPPMPAPAAPVAPAPPVAASPPAASPPSPAPRTDAPPAGDFGHPTPLTAQPVSRPPDEPPVEIWRAEGLAESAPPVGERPFLEPTVVEPTVVQPPPVRPPSVEPPVELDAFEQLAGPAVDDVASAARLSGPPVAPEPGPPSPPEAAYQTPAYDSPTYDTPTYDTPTYATPASDPTADTSADAGGPLPTRVPGKHLSHQPATTGDATDVAADPMRPYRVHELLTRHEQGKRRGHDADAAPGEPTDSTSGTPVPGAPGHVQEDGR